MESTDFELLDYGGSPDGNTLFLNLYHPARTLAITGDWSILSRETSPA